MWGQSSDFNDDCDNCKDFFLCWGFDPGPGAYVHTHIHTHAKGHVIYIGICNKNIFFSLTEAHNLYSKGRCRVSKFGFYFYICRTPFFSFLVRFYFLEGYNGTPSSTTKKKKKTKKKHLVSETRASRAIYDYIYRSFFHFCSFNIVVCLLSRHWHIIDLAWFGFLLAFYLVALCMCACVCVSRFFFSFISNNLQTHRHTTKI